MLGLGSSVNSEEAYAKGERYRERFHTGSTYNSSSNPIGRKGREADYIGDFSDASHIDDYTTSNVNIYRISETLRLDGTAANGYAAIAVSVVPNVNYTATCLFDPNNSANSQGTFKVGTSADDDTFFSATTITDNTTHTANFNSGDNSVIWLTFVCVRSAKRCFYDNISFKEA
tara:strand:+ start:2096 stop:2614 length:519 start_codon:yes stop_codon:yes gene_type:complete